MIAGLALLLAAHPAAGLRAEMEGIAAAAQGRVGAAVMIVETGEAVSLHGTDRFPMQSVYKLPIGMALLHEVDRGVLRLDGTARVRKADLVPPGFHSPVRDRYPQGDVDVSLRELLRLMVAESDGTASDVLLRVCGGPDRINAYLHRLKVKGLAVATSEREMAAGPLVQYRNWATPLAMLDLLRALQQGRGLSPASRELLLQYMTETATGGHRIKGPLPPDAVVAHKTGTSGTADGLTRATNDAGLVSLPGGRHLAIGVFVSDSRAEESVREGVIARIARAAWDYAQTR